MFMNTTKKNDESTSVLNTIIYTLDNCENIFPDIFPSLFVVFAFKLIFFYNLSLTISALALILRITKRINSNLLKYLALSANIKQFCRLFSLLPIILNIFWYKRRNVRCQLTISNCYKCETLIRLPTNLFYQTAKAYWKYKMKENLNRNSSATNN